MDFFQRQDNARHKTKWLVLYFGLTTLLTILAVYLVSACIYVLKFQGRRYHHGGEFTLWNGELFFWVTIGTLIVIVSGSLYKMAQLAQGGAGVASSLGGEPLNLNTTDSDERKLRNVVEEMAIASGVPVPQIFVLRNEDGINAFAAGFTTSDAVIGVTRGAMQTLTRDELQGVIGHEFSHILNGDMRLNMRLIGVLNGILCVALCGKILLRAMVQTRSRSGKDDGRGLFLLIGGALVVVGSIGLFFARLIKSAISRQREFLADAASVQFTRNPPGLAGALKKIGGSGGDARLEAPNAEEASHLFFANALAESWTDWIATHPPLEERIRALEPSWDGKYPVVQRAVQQITAEEARTRTLEKLVQAGSWGGIAAMAQPLRSEQVTIPMERPPTPQQVAYAVGLRSAIPDELRSSAREALGASTIIYSLLLDDDETIRTAQLRELAENNPDTVNEETVRRYPAVAVLDARLKLPLINLCLPALRQLSKTQYQQFTENVRRLIESDRQILLFEYMVQKLVLRHLEPIFNEVRKPVIQYYVFKPMEEDAVVLLSILARHGSEDPGQRQSAFRCGVQQLAFSRVTPVLMEEGQCGLPQMDVALNRLAQAAPAVKKSVLNACACVVAADGLVEVKEAEMLRAIADAIDCPIPPFVQNI